MAAADAPAPAVSAAPASPSTDGAASTPSPVVNLEARIAAKKAELAQRFSGEPALDDEPAPVEAEGEEAVESDEAEGEQPGDEEAEAADEAARLAEVEQELEQTRAEAAARDGQWRDAAKQTLAQSRILAERVSVLEAILEENGIELDPRIEENLELKAKLIRADLQQVQPKQAEPPPAPEVQAAVTKLSGELDAAAKESGVDRVELFVAWNAMRDAGRAVSLADVGRLMAAQVPQPKQAAARKQAAVNRQAAAPLRGRVAGAVPTPDLTTEAGRRRHIEALGLIKRG